MLAVVAGPAAIVLAVVLALGGGAADDDGADELPLDFAETASAGQELLVQGAGETVVLWGTPSDVDPAGVECSTRDGALDVDGAPQVDGAQTRTDGDGTAWTRLVALEDTQRTVTCSGGGLTQFGQSTLPEGPPTQGGIFFGIFGVVTTLLGVLAFRLSRRRG